MFICKGCNLKWMFISFNLLFANCINLFLNVAFFEYVIWIGITSWFSIIRCIFVTLSLNICLSQLYRWIYNTIACFPEIMMSKLYWVLIVWTIFCSEFVVIVFEYINSNKSS